MEDLDEEDPEGPDASDLQDDDFALGTPCPYCRKPIYDDAEVCPNCHNYVSREDAPSKTSGWIILGVIVALIVILLVWLH
jgi:predicted nucleic acid-binding Zn ribbon protein